MRAGILNVCKQSGWTSHDVVAKVRRLARQKRVGHAGTLDPMAEGVLPVLLGRATRLADLVQSGDKEYRAEVHLGVATTTDDAEGELLERAAVPPFDRDAIEAALARFRGRISQLPPAYSAIKVQGQRAYAVARRGGAPDLRPRDVTISDLRLVDFGSDWLALDVRCSRGTYVRALARDLAVALGSVGHLTRLVRTAVGPFRIRDALTLDDIAAQGVAAALLPPDRALPDAPAHLATVDEARLLTNGQSVSTTLRADRVWVRDQAGCVVCLGSADGQVLRSRVLLV